MTQLFPRAGRFARGYDPTQVDDFFARAREAYEDDAVPAQGIRATAAPLSEQSTAPGSIDSASVRTAAFDMVRSGYRHASVDAALDRLEVAFLHRDRAEYIAQHGQSAWMAEVVERATTLYERLTRPRGERFAPPGRGQGYDRSQVDDLLDRLVDFFDSGTSVTASEVRAVTFSSAPRARAYDEGTVDAFLDRAVDVLLAVE